MRCCSFFLHGIRVYAGKTLSLCSGVIKREGADTKERRGEPEVTGTAVFCTRRAATHLACFSYWFGHNNAWGATVVRFPLFSSYKFHFLFMSYAWLHLSFLCFLPSFTMLFSFNQSLSVYCLFLAYSIRYLFSYSLSFCIRLVLSFHVFPSFLQCLIPSYNHNQIRY